MGILNVKDLSLTMDGTPILDDVSVEFQDGKIHALVGPNGAGKSSLAYAIMGLEDYDEYEGDITFKGESLNGLSVYERAERGITLAWQEPARFEGMTVRQFIEASAEEDSEESVESSIEKVGMDPDQYLDRGIDSSLSGGERKKLELASILAMEPDLVLLDEPDSGIDVASLDRIFEGIEFLKNKGTTVILITHSATVLEQAEYAFLMCFGRIIDRGDIDKIGRYFEEECFECEAFSDQDKAIEEWEERKEKL